MKSDILISHCDVCGQTKPEMFKIYFDGYLKLYKCKTCGFVAQYPGPGKNTIIFDYKDKYQGFIEKQKVQEFLYPERQKALQDILNRIITYKASGRILDVGSGDGQFLHLCSKKGFECYGVDDSKILSEYASKKTNAKITQGLYDKKMFPQSYFDAISLIQVLEHIPNPTIALETAKYHLRPGGILLIEVPSIHNPRFLAYQWTGIKSFVKPPDGIIETHCGYYTQKVLKILTEKCGFKELGFTTGRWQYKYDGFFGIVGKVVDPLLNSLKIGGILYIGKKN